MRVAELGEFGLLRELGLANVDLPSGWLGPGDDTAILPPPTGGLLFTADLLVEGVHFRTDTCPAADLGYKTLAVNVSDVAAMGGRPLAFTLSITLPGKTSVSWVRDLHRGLREAAAAFDCPLVGGDTTSGPVVTLSVAVLGEAPAAGAVRRSGATPGDDLFLSGWVGESALGLRLLEAGAEAEVPDGPALMRRHHRPEPRLALGRALAEAGLATAMIDVSDGLLQDLGHVLTASRAGADLRLERLALSPALRRGAERLGLDPREAALAGGEDYELLFTSPPGHRAAVFAAARAAATPVRRIGAVRPGEGLTLWEGDRPVAPPGRGGFDHFGSAG